MNSTHERILNVLQNKMVNSNHGFFSNLVMYKLAQLSSNMHATVSFAGGKKIPTNIYVLNLATSGFSKGRGNKFLEDEVFSDFKEKFTKHVMIDRPKAVVTSNAEQIALISGERPDLVENGLWKIITELPQYVYAYGSGTTTEGLKGMMTKLSMIRTGAVSIEIDEIGSNLTTNKEVMDTLLESYDAGLTKNKLKLTSSNGEIENPVPTNLMMFGTPSKLFDGGKTEEELISFLDTGYARRLLFGYVHNETKKMSAADRIASLTDTTLEAEISTLCGELGLLGTTAKYAVDNELDSDANIALFEYQEACEDVASKFKSHEDIQKTEMEHRYFKVLKIAGTYAFIEGSPYVVKRHIEEAIEVVQESGEQFNKMMQKDKAYIRLAKYIAEENGASITYADLTTDLKFFKGSESQKRDMIMLARSWAASNNVVITERISNDITYFTGEMIKETDLNKMIVSTSVEFADNYKPIFGEWDNFKKLVTMDINFSTHHYTDNHRDDSKAKRKFNLLVLDVEDSVPLDMAKRLMKDYKAIYYTTKRHTAKDNRYRIIMPLSKTLNLDVETHKDFYKNIFEWLPFSVDEIAHASAKWQCYKGSEVSWNDDGIMFDPQPFIPNTTKEKNTKQRLHKFGGTTTKLEQHILANTKGRNNALLRLAMVHVDSGKDEDTIRALVLSTNNKLDDALSEGEIDVSIMKTVRKKIADRE